MLEFTYELGVKDAYTCEASGSGTQGSRNMKCCYLNYLVTLTSQKMKTIRLLEYWTIPNCLKIDTDLASSIERAANNTDPTCRWLFYKDVDKIPEKYYERIGQKKPARSK